MHAGMQVLNEMYASDLKEVLSASSTSAGKSAASVSGAAGGSAVPALHGSGMRTPVDDLTFISIDATGVDIRVRHGSEFSVERIGFSKKVRYVCSVLRPACR